MTGNSQTQSTSSAGSSNAAELGLAYMTKEVEVVYDVSAAGDIVIGIAHDGGPYREFHRETIGSGGGSDVLQFWTVHNSVRAYADSNDFADGDITTIRVAAAAEV